MKVSSDPKPASLAHVLLVDDHSAGLRCRKTILEELGYQVTTAPGAEEAMKVIAKEAFDVIVTDYKMPKVDGVQLIERIQKLKPEIPIILLSGYVDILGLNEASTKADLVIAKNSREVENLVRGVARFLRRKAPKKPPSTARGMARAKASGL
jgi:CheY-like chemotaxis protein